MQNETNVKSAPRRTAKQQIAELDTRLGAGQGAVKERAKLALRIEKEEAAAKEAATKKVEKKPKPASNPNKKNKRS
jgi:hypothetical protein